MLVARLQAFCASIKVKSIGYGPDVAVIVALDLGRKVIVYNCFTERPAGCSEGVLAVFRRRGRGSTYDVRQGVLMRSSLLGMPNKQYEVAYRTLSTRRHMISDNVSYSRRKKTYTRAIAGQYRYRGFGSRCLVGKQHTVGRQHQLRLCRRLHGRRHRRWLSHRERCRKGFHRVSVRLREFQ